MIAFAPHVFQPAERFVLNYWLWSVQAEKQGRFCFLWMCVPVAGNTPDQIGHQSNADGRLGLNHFDQQGVVLLSDGIEANN